MVKKILVAAVVCLVIACKKNVEFHNSSIVGKWKLTEFFTDPGDGSGSWHEADIWHPRYLEFNSDGTLTISPDNIYNSSDHYQLTSDSTMIFINGSQNLHLWYHFSETLLTLYPPCFEGCGKRYIPVK